MELSVAIQAKVEVTPSNWNFGFQPTFFEFFPDFLRLSQEQWHKETHRFATRL